MDWMALGVERAVECDDIWIHNSSSSTDEKKKSAQSVTPDAVTSSMLGNGQIKGTFTHTHTVQCNSSPR